LVQILKDPLFLDKNFESFSSIEEEYSYFWNYTFFLVTNFNGVSLFFLQIVVLLAFVFGWLFK
jgi:hypothetical protein